MGVDVDMVVAVAVIVWMLVLTAGQKCDDEVCVLVEDIVEWRKEVKRRISEHWFVMMVGEDGRQGGQMKVCIFLVVVVVVVVVVVAVVLVTVVVVAVVVLVMVVVVTVQRVWGHFWSRVLERSCMQWVVTVDHALKDTP